MRKRLVDSAFLVFARHGLDSSVVGRIIAQAGVSRGTFYHYFRTDQDLYQAVASQVSDEIIHLVDPLVLLQEDPAVRVSTGIRLAIDIAARHPLLAQFLDRGGPAALRSGPGVRQSVSRDLHAGMALGMFSLPNLEMGLDLVLGPVQMTFHRVLEGAVSEAYAISLAQAILSSLGVERAVAERVSQITLTPIVLPADSTLAWASAVSSSAG